MNNPRNNVKISKADFADLDDILNLQMIAFISEAELYNNYNIAPLVQTKESMIEDFNKYIFLKAVTNNKIIGSVKGRDMGEYCWIGRLMVLPEYQNKGIGKELMHAIEKEFPATPEFLLCTGYKSVKNMRLYESLGYNRMEDSTPGIDGDVELIKMVKHNNTAINI
ncbi:MAG: GNAT family N-acetyltransferase [Bacteroidales bacterium]|nr:GNAT family N-acetyltransferase [Bacteroidales bacterium]